MKHKISDGTSSVDVVYTWVDMSQDGYLERCKKYAEHPKDVNPERFRSTFQLLKYSLRSLQEYVDWFNRVFIVTARPQVPEWLDTDHEKIKVIHHDQIIDNEYLPTFNPNTIESFLHRIPGLSEEFLYMNDDFLFGSPTHLRDFKPNGKYRIFNTLFGENLSWRIYDGKNDIFGLGLIEHTPLYIKKRFWKAMTELYPEKMHKTRKNKFRRDSDLMTYKFYRYYMLKYQREISDPISIKKLLEINKFHKLTNNFKTQKKMLKIIEQEKPKFYCLNDDMGDHPDPDVVNLVQSFLDRYHPVSSSFEKA